MIDRNHPAVEALGFEGFDHEGGTMHAWRCEYPDRYPGYCTCPEEAVAIVRDNLTADDLRNTPAGKQLLAEGWEAACRKVIRMAWADSSDAEYLADEGNPYRKDKEEGRG